MGKTLFALSSRIHYIELCLCAEGLIGDIDTSDLSCRRPDLMFKPDYSVVVTEDCTYLDVNVAAYINAYKSTLMQREKGRDDISMAGDFASRSPSLTSRKITASTRKEIVNLSIKTCVKRCVKSNALSYQSAPILDPTAMLVPERVRNSIIEAKEAVKQLNSRENGSAHESFGVSGFVVAVVVAAGGIGGLVAAGGIVVSVTELAVSISSSTTTIELLM
uniref:ZP domain-containing protein n=1 Tax=Angiostrongylus cantonensis TaxID=6313 RepID=A0A0K0CWV1_ANGCA